MSDDGESDEEAGAKRPSRPDNAAARRQRRRSDRGEPTSRRKSPDAASSGSRSGSHGATNGKPGTIEERQPLPQRIARYIREVLAELRKVVWPTRKQMSTYTAVVLAFVAFMIGLVWMLDLLFARAMFALFG